MTKKHCFIAIHIPDELRPQLDALQTHLKAGKPTPTNNYHITLKFLGHLTDEQIVTISNELSKIKLPSFTVSTKGTGKFLTRRNLCLWAGIELNHGLNALQKRIDDVAKNIFNLDPSSSYTPHITLARLHRDQQEEGAYFLENTQSFTLPDFKATQFELFENKNDAETGAIIHEVIQTFPLKN